MRSNTGAWRRLLRPGCRLIAVVKADAYGHGAVAIARAVLAAGADELAVATAGEGAQLRAAGIAAPILVVGPSAPGDAEAIVGARLRPAIADLATASALAAAAGERPLEVEIEVDTGMRRHGVAAGEFAALLRALRVHRSLRVVSVFTHFAGLDRAALPALQQQWQAFTAAVGEPGGVFARHACNTLATLLLPAAHADAVRIGGGLYGFVPGDLADPGLVPALALKSRVVGVRAAAAGDRVGYGGAHTCARATTLALLPCGYADGLTRAHWNGGDVLLRGGRARIVGHVSMNQMVVDVGDLGAAIGDEVVLLGRQGDERIRAEARAGPSGSAYEVTSLLRTDLPRRYVSG